MVCQLETYITTNRLSQYYGIYGELFSSVKNDLKFGRPSHASVEIGSLCPQCTCDYRSKPWHLVYRQEEYGMASRTSKNKVDMTPVPDRYRIFQYHRKKNMLVVFPDGEVVEGRPVNVNHSLLLPRT